MIYDIFLYSYSRVHVNGFWEIIITFLFYFLILIYFFYFWYYVSYPYYACEIRFKNDQNLLGWKKTPNECHEFFLSSDGGKCSAISRSQGTSVPQTKRSWTNDDVLVKMLCKRMRSWTLNFNLNNSILVSFDINLDIFYFQWLSSALLLFLMTFHLLFKAQNGGKQLWRGKLPNLPDSLIKIKLGIFSVTSV